EALDGAYLIPGSRSIVRADLRGDAFAFPRVRERSQGDVHVVLILALPIAVHRLPAADIRVMGLEQESLEANDLALPQGLQLCPIARLFASAQVRVFLQVDQHLGREPLRRRVHEGLAEVVFHRVLQSHVGQGGPLALRTASPVDRVGLGDRGKRQPLMVAAAIRESRLSQAGAQCDERKPEDARPLPGPLSTSKRLKAHQSRKRASASNTIARVATAIPSSASAPTNSGRTPCRRNWTKLVRSPTPAKVSKKAQRLSQRWRDIHRISAGFDWFAEQLERGKSQHADPCPNCTFAVRGEGRRVQRGQRLAFLRRR